MNKIDSKYRFKIKATLFCGLILLLLFISFLINKTNNNHLTYKIPIQKKTLIIGDSHALFGINADTIQNAHSCCYYHESNALTYFKLKFIHQQNKHIKNIITSISYQKFSCRFDSTFSNSTLSNEIFKHYSPIIQLNDIKEFKINYVNYFENYFRFKIFPNFESWNITNKSDIEYPYEKKSFIITKKSCNNSKLKQNVLRYFPDSCSNKSSTIDILYVDSIANYTQQNGLHLIFVFLPQQQHYIDAIPQFIKDRYENLKIELKRYSNVYIIDEVKTLPNIYFFDYSHLNLDGSTYMSKIVKTKITQINSNNSQLTMYKPINSYSEQ